MLNEDRGGIINCSEAPYPLNVVVFRNKPRNVVGGGGVVLYWLNSDVHTFG